MPMFFWLPMIIFAGMLDVTTEGLTPRRAEAKVPEPR